MADTKITALTALTAADPINDVIPIVDVSDTTMAASGTTKKISVNNILSSSPTASGALTVTGLVTAGSATITGALTVDTTTLVVDPTNDRVGIRTASPADIVEVVGSGSTGIRVSRSGALTQYATLSAGATGPTLDASSALSSLSFGIAGTTGLTLNSTANLVLKGGTAGANGVGVTFPATQVASSDANCLDDYEEGTFTPNIGGTATYTTQTGRYTKIGNRVHVTMRLTILLKGTGSNYEIGGLPFSAASPGAAISVGYFASLATSVDYISGYAIGSAINMTGTTAATANITNAIAVIGNATDLNMSFSYEV